jgi:hypothetical protein
LRAATPATAAATGSKPACEIFDRQNRSEGNEENGYPVLDSSKTKINDIKELNHAHKNNLKEEILQVITENFMEMILDIVNQNIQDALKKFQDTKNKEDKKTQKQIN